MNLAPGGNASQSARNGDSLLERHGVVDRTRKPRRGAAADDRSARDCGSEQKRGHECRPAPHRVVIAQGAVRYSVCGTCVACIPSTSAAASPK
jgi:hypothetical protein